MKYTLADRILAHYRSFLKFAFIAQ